MSKDMAELTRRLADTAIEQNELYQAAKRDAEEAEAYAAELEAKLAKAVDALETIRFFSGVHAAGSDLEHIKESVNDVANKALAELKGQNDE